MAYETFSGALDGDSGYVPFSGELDKPAPSGLLSGTAAAVGQGWDAMTRAVGATGNLITGDNAAVEARAAEQDKANQQKPVELQSFMREVQTEAARTRELTGENGVLDTIGTVAKAAWNNPTGFVQFNAEQAANMAPVMAGGLGGAKLGAMAGSAFGPVGTVIGGTAGMFLGYVFGNSAIEAGNKGMEKAKDGLTDAERGEALQEGVTKGAVIGTVDTLTMGAGGLIGRKLFGDAIKAGSMAEAKALIDAGVDIANPRAIATALADESIRSTAKAAGEAAAKAAMTTGQKAAFAGSNVAMQMGSEGVGEYFGEMAATGKGDIVDAVLESMAGGGSAVVETAYSYNQAKNESLSVKGILQAGSFDEALDYFRQTVSSGEADAAAAVGQVAGAIDEFKTSDMTDTAVLGLPSYAGEPLVTFPDGSTMTGAEAEQRRLAGMSQPLAAEAAQSPALDAITPRTGSGLMVNPAVPKPDAQIITPAEQGLADQALLKQKRGELLTIDEAAALRRMNRAAAPDLATAPASRQVTPVNPADIRQQAEANVTAKEQEAATSEILASGGVSYAEPRTVGGLPTSKLTTERLQQIAVDGTLNANTRRAAQAAIAARLSLQSEVSQGQSETAQQPTDVSNAPAADAKFLADLTGGQAQLRTVSSPVQAGERVGMVMRKAIEQMGRLTGTRVVFYSGTNGDGFTRGKNDNTVYVNVRAGVNPFQVMGHEATHVLKKRHAEAWSKIRDAVVAGMGENKAAALEQFAANYWIQDEVKNTLATEIGYDTQLTPEQRADLYISDSFNTIEEFLLDEMISDLGGEQWTSADFWSDVFSRIEQEHGTEKAKGIVQRLVNSIKLLLSQFQKIIEGRFTEFKTGKELGEHVTPEQIKAIKDAISDAYAEWISAERTNEPAGYVRGQEPAVATLESAPNRTQSESDRTQSGNTTADTIEAMEAGEVVQETTGRKQVERPIEAKEAEKIKKLGFNVRGQVVSGSPPFIQSLRNVRDQIKQAVADAKSDQAHPADATWYRDAGSAIREYSHGDKVLMEKLTRIVAKLSQGAGVNSNVTSVIKAAYQISAGETPAVGRFPNAFRQDFGPLVSAPVFDDKLNGVNTKLQNFYRNLHDEVFQRDEWPNAVVIDRHAINYIWQQTGKDSVASDAQYDYAERVVQLATEQYNKEMGTSWKPRDMQAVLWGFWKRRDEAETQTGNADEGGAWNYPQFFERATANVTAEVLPSTKVSKLDLELNAKDKNEFQRQALDLIYQGGHNELAKRAGIVLYREGESTGGYEDKINPNMVTGAISQKIAKESGSSDKYHRYTYEAVDRYALGWQYIFKQDGVPWFRADKTIDPADLDKARAAREKRIAAGKKVAENNTPPMMSQGYFIVFDRNLTAEDEAAMFKALQEYIASGVGYTKMKPNAIAVINYRDENGKPFMMSDEDFKAAVNRFADGDMIASNEPFAAETRYHYYDFLEENTGERILEDERLESGERDFQDWLRGRREAFDALVTEWEGRRPNDVGRQDAGAGAGNEVTRSERRQGSVSGVGVHYSDEQRSTLSSFAFGRGLKAAEFERIQNATDPRIKHRIYFYMNTGRGISPEVGVGAYAHQANLDNLYDMTADELDLAVGKDANSFESAVIDAGFNGYMSQDSGIAILLGMRNQAVEYVGTGKQSVGQAGKADKSLYGKARVALLARKDLPAGQMKGSEWKAKLPELNLSHLDDDALYFRDGILAKPGEKGDNSPSGRRTSVANATAPSGAVSVFSEARVLDQARGKTVTRQVTIAETGETVQLKNQDAEAAIRQLRRDIEALDALRICAGV